VSRLLPRRRARRSPALRPVLATLLLMAGPLAAAAPADAPFLWRNSAAFTAPAGLPRARSARLPAQGTTSLALATEVASQFSQDAEADAAAVIDVETTTFLLSLDHGFTERWSAGLELPLLHHDGGFLDSIIDDYHDLLGLPDGGRPSRPNNEVFVAWRDGALLRRSLISSASGVGDVRVHVARALTTAPERTTALRLGVELPTGRVRDLTGNDGVDLSVALHVTDRRLLRSSAWTVHGAAGVLVQLDRDEVYGRDGESFAAFGNLSLAWRLSERWTLKGQLDGHSRTADTRLRQVGGWSVQALLGASLRLSDRFRFEGGFAEDLPPGSAPDVAFMFALRGEL
jgi:hypothetical protein